ncbi:MAG: hypothetical protein P8179_00935 [Candidatus Thiodiazotropha sp.]|jgi:hypothetical protein
MRKSPIIGLIIAPFAGAVAYMLLVFIFGEDNTPKQDYTGLQAWPIYFAMFIATTLLCYLVSILAGIPLVSYLKRYGKLNFWIMLLVSTPMGAVSLSLVIYLLVHNEKHILIPLLIFMGYGAVMGAVVSVTYCWLAGITTRS